MRILCLSIVYGFFPLLLSAQPTTLRLQQSCAFFDPEPHGDTYLYDPSDEAARIVAEIVDALGLTKNFLVKASSVRNAVATELDGQRYILYSTTFLEKFKADERTRWAAYAVLAHEIGHHLNNDNFGEADLKRRKICELEADRFSGSVLRMLGANLEQAQSGIESLEKEAETTTHPPKIARREAVATGWKKRDEFLQARGDVGLSAPDRDGDRVPDARDECPSDYGTHASGCPDSDEDGIPDKNDQCPYEKGLANNRGCPAATDRDADGVPDAGDQCPDKKGELRYAGCPDSDGDGVPDHKDKCLNQKGLPANDGCPAASVPLLYEGSNTDRLAVPEAFRGRKSGLEMVRVEGGTYLMGSPESESGRDKSECQHSVTLGGFSIGRYEVTQADWVEVMGSNPSYFNKENCLDCPVESVSWNDLQEFFKKLNARYPGRNYRLPTEEEWEFAARGGNNSQKSIYAGSNNLGLVAWYAGNSGNKPHSVGGRKANELGIYDMSGNVYEWCQDKQEPYAGCSPFQDTKNYILRGGSWGIFDVACRSANRYGDEISRRNGGIGFRLAHD
jgi:formylglycine-generating enzyme required for sulfatase activity